MLKVTQISQPDQKWQLFADFDSRDTLWVVSDLRSKVELQEALLKKAGSFEERSVLRASEFWRSLILYLKPDYSIVPSFVAEGLLKDHFLRENPEAVLQSKTYLQAMMQFLPILSHPVGLEQLSDWLDLDEARKAAWLPWILRAKKAWDVLRERKVIPQEGASSLLVDADLNLDLGIKKIVFDLGGQLQFIESQIIKNLARSFEVTVIAPSLNLREPLNWFMTSYQEVIDSAVKVSRLEKSDLAGAIEFDRFVSPVAEVKQAAFLIEKDLRAGGSPFDWVVVFPREGQYEDILAHHFDMAGIPHSFLSRTSYFGMPWVRKWFAEMELQSREFSTANLEWNLFHQRQRPDVDHLTFVSYLSHIYSEDDVSRFEGLKPYLEQNPPEVLTGDGFLEWACMAADRARVEEEQILQLLSAFQKDIRVDLPLSLRHWLWLCKEFCIQKKIPTPSRSKGVEIVNLMSAESLVRTKKIFLGLTERNLKSENAIPLFATDVYELFTDLAFVISHPDSHELEFELEWLTQAQSLQSYFFTSSTDRSGAPASPCLFWLSQSKDQDSISEPGLTLWDQKQRHLAKDLSDEPVKIGIDRDQGLWNWDLAKRENLRLSASSLESFVKCPFIFKSQRIFGLGDPVVLDLDLDPRDKGQIYHSVCEGILKENWIDKTETPEFDVWLRALVAEHWKTSVSPLTIAMLLIRLKEFIKGFVALEKKWQADYPQSHPVAFEKEFKFQIQNKEIVGKIDRIDADESGRCVLIDYKSTDSDLQQVSQWLKNDKLQMAIYTLAIEQGAALPSHEVVAAHYYSFYPLERKKGFTLEGRADGLVPPPATKAGSLTSEGKAEWLAATSDKIQSYVKTIDRGELYPIPKNKTTCESCRWRGLCRAPHLN